MLKAARVLWLCLHMLTPCTSFRQEALPSRPRQSPKQHSTRLARPSWEEGCVTAQICLTGACKLVPQHSYGRGSWPCINISSKVSV